jgi:hypothetical protein
MTDKIMNEPKRHVYEAGSVLSARAERNAEPLDLVVDDWNVLFHAVLERLKKTVGEVRVAATELQKMEPVNPVQVVVLECVEALSQLYTALKHERVQRQFPTGQENCD